MSILGCTICTLFLQGGGAWMDGPHPGDWWTPTEPWSFSHFGASYGAGIKVGQVAISAERAGRFGSEALACRAADPLHCPAGMPMSAWSLVERPRGAWATWEPRLPYTQRWFGQIGVGAYVPALEVNIYTPLAVKQLRAASFTPTFGTDKVTNQHWSAGWIVGVGYQVAPHVDLLSNVRSINGRNATNEGNNFTTASSIAVNLTVRVSL